MSDTATIIETTPETLPAEVPPTQVMVPVEPVTTLTMIDRAVNGGTDIETLERLMALHEKWQAAQARKLFVSAMIKAKNEFNAIHKRSNGYNDNYKYEELIHVIDAVEPSLTKHGFIFNWEHEDGNDGSVRTTCIVTHEGGHEIRNSLSGKTKDVAVQKANMNEFQRKGGAVTYLQRYTLKSALGLSASHDDDSQSNGNQPDTSGNNSANIKIFNTGPWIGEIDTAFKACNNDMVKAIKAKITSAANSSEMPLWAYKEISGHYSAQIKRAKEIQNANS